MRSSLKTLLLGTALAAAAGLSAQAAEFVTNCGFESLTNSHGQLAYNTDATGWNVPPPSGSYAFAFDVGNVGTG